jgi:hypothetical protein
LAGDHSLAWLGADADQAKFVMDEKLPEVDFIHPRLEILFPAF